MPWQCSPTGCRCACPTAGSAAELVEPFVDPVLHRLSRDYVGDSAETIALLWPDCRGGSKPQASPRCRRH